MGLIIAILLSIAGLVICRTRAEKLNRNKFLWGGLGFVLPVIGIIIIFLMEPKEPPVGDQ